MGWITQKPRTNDAVVSNANYLEKNYTLTSKIRIISVSISLEETGRLWGDITLFSENDVVLAEVINGTIIRINSYRQKRLSYVFPTPLEIFPQENTKIQYHVFNNNNLDKRFSYTLQYQKWMDEKDE